MRFTHALVAVVGVASAASAQSFSSFNNLPISGIAIENTGLLQYKVTLQAGATVNVGGTDYSITDVFGFWALSEDIDLAGSTTGFDVWDAKVSNSGIGGIVGWKTNPNTGITVGNSEVFTFDSLATADVDAWGAHIRVDGNSPLGETFYAYIPTPGTMAPLALVGFVAARRRR